MRELEKIMRVGTFDEWRADEAGGYYSSTKWRESESVVKLQSWPRRRKGEWEESAIVGDG